MPLRAIRAKKKEERGKMVKSPKKHRNRPVEN